MATITSKPFGTTRDGSAVRQFTLQNASGARAEILDYGGIIRSLTVPDRHGKPVDVVLGYDDLASYEANDGYFGALVGRYANRIDGGRFILNGRFYSLYCNDGKNHLHGGQVGFNKRVWQAEPADGALALRYDSPDGEEHFPGRLQVTVTYSLSDQNALTIDYRAVSDADTLCNLTNHSYFNLNGQQSGPVYGQLVQINADRYLPTDATAIPTGVADVEGTPMDFRTPTPIGAHIDDDFEQLRLAGGYDHNFILRDFDGTLREAVNASAEESGITLAMSTTLPGVQFYTANFVADGRKGKDGAAYQKRGAFCLESQFFPNLTAFGRYPQAILRKGETFHQTTVYRFGLR